MSIHQILLKRLIQQRKNRSSKLKNKLGIDKLKNVQKGLDSLKSKVEQLDIDKLESVSQ